MRRFTTAELDFLRDGYLKMNIRQLTAAFNTEFGMIKSETAILAALKNHGFRAFREHKNRLVDNRLRIFTQEQVDFIATNYAGRSVVELTGMFNQTFGDEKSVAQIRTAVHNRGFISGRSGCFEKGHRPHNYGEKGWDSGGNSAKTRFRKGNRPHTWVPVGSPRLSKDGIFQRKVSDTGYVPRDWKSVHSLLWEEHYGPIPPGHIVVFRNGDRADIRIENLELITRVELMRRNTIHNLPEALADICRTVGVLNRHINKREGKHEKQN